MLRMILKALGLKFAYRCNWGEYTHKYDSIDCYMSRPIHKDMSVAPPWAKLTFRVRDRIIK
jgi:hypothetical protein